MLVSSSGLLAPDCTANMGPCLVYLEYVYFERRSQGQMGNMAVQRAPGVYSDNVNSGGRTTYGTVTA